MTTAKLSVGILIISDTAAQDPKTDTSGDLLRDVFRTHGGDAWDLTKLRIQIVPDNVVDIQQTVLQWTDGEEPRNLIITSGGTGFAVKDQTPEVIDSIFLDGLLKS